MIESTIRSKAAEQGSTSNYGPAEADKTVAGAGSEGTLAPVNLPGVWRQIDRLVLIATSLLVSVVGIAFAVLVTLEVLFRYVLGYSAIWADPTATILLVWFFLIGASLALRARAHVSFELALHYLPRTAAWTTYVIGQILTFLFLIIVFWSGYRALPSALRQIDSALQISMFWVMLSIPVGFFLLIYTQIMLFAETLVVRRQGT